MNRPVFIIGAARSGTTMLGEILSRHPDVAYWLEPKYIWRYGNAGAKDDIRTSEEAKPAVVRYIRKKFESFLYSKNRKIFIEKTPSNVFRIPFIQAVFPEARFIHIMRDGRDVILSAEKKWTSRPDRTALHRRLVKMEIPLKDLPYYGVNIIRDVIGRIFLPKKGFIWGPMFPGISEYRAHHSVIETCALQWVKSVEECQKAFENIQDEKVFDLKYEEFLEQPREVLEDILNFAGLDMQYSLNMLQDFELKTKNSRSESDIQKLKAIDSIVDDKLKQLGYKK